MKLVKNKCFKYVYLSLLLFTQASAVSAGDAVYFETADGVSFWCDQTNLNYNLDLGNGKLAAICSILVVPGKTDGLSKETAFKLDLNGKLFKKYILDFFRYGKVAFKNKIDAENTLAICEDLGLPLAAEYICTNVLRRKPDSALEVLGKFVEIRGGTFQMGSPIGEQNRKDDETQHWVTLSDFELCEAAITQETYAKILGTNPSRFKEQKYCPDSFKIIENSAGQQIGVCADHPVEQVNWNDAIQFINTVNAKFRDSGYKFSLPTEAQFEYAFRGGTETAFVSGTNAAGMEEYMWPSTTSMWPTHPVKSKRANAFGIYQSSVREWTNDWYGAYPAGEATDPQGPVTGYSRSIRGGGTSLKGFCPSRSAYRGCTDPDNTGGVFDGSLGFRLLRSRNF
jgi:formylglycine-generating enzyme required for sulfatase activity